VDDPDGAAGPAGHRPPSITLDNGQRSEDDLTHKLVDIIRINQRFMENREAGAPQLIIEDLWELLQYHVTTFMDNEIRARRRRDTAPVARSRRSPSASRARRAASVARCPGSASTSRREPSSRLTRRSRSTKWGFRTGSPAR